MTHDLVGLEQDNAIDVLFGALERGDVAAARGALLPDARIWHCFDRIAMTVDESMAQWEELIAGSRARYVIDSRRQGTANEYVQQHTFVIEQNGGQRLAWAVCVVVKISDGRIARLDEYIDRSGHFVPSNDCT